jgi:hypothetical protein
MYADQQDRESNEFVFNWGQPIDQEYSILSDGDGRKILLIQGCYEYEEDGNRKKKYNHREPSDSAGKIVQEVHKYIDDDLQETSLGFLFHPGTGYGNFNQEFERLLDSEFSESMAFRGRHSKGKIGKHKNTSISRLAKKVAIGDGDWSNAFDEVWGEQEGDSELEKKLNLLHFCLTPNGAKKSLDAFPPEQWPEETWLAVEELAYYPRNHSDDDWLDSDSEYMRKLTDLRNRLLDAPS